IRKLHSQKKHYYLSIFIPASHILSPCPYAMDIIRIHRIFFHIGYSTDAPEIMAHYNHIIVGSGMTGDAAVKGIRSSKKNDSIAVIGSEKDKPYDRPPLSKKLWKGEQFDSIWRNTPETDLHFYLGRNVSAIDPLKKR